jgi:hypothetical protein
MKGETVEPRPDLVQEIVSEVGLEDFQFLYVPQRPIYGLR